MTEATNTQPRDPIYTNFVDGYGVDVFRTWDEVSKAVQALIEEYQSRRWTDPLYFEDDSGDIGELATTEEALAELQQGNEVRLYRRTDERGPSFVFTAHY